MPSLIMLSDVAERFNKLEKFEKQRDTQLMMGGAYVTYVRSFPSLWGMFINYVEKGEG